LNLGPENLVNVLAELANDRQVSASQLKEARIGLPSFLSAKWTGIVPKFSLNTVFTMARHEFDSFSIPPVLLLPSFHKTIAEVTWRILDIRGKKSHEREEAQVRVFDTVYPTVEKCFCVLTLHQVP
jgi:hypothetical protein